MQRNFKFDIVFTSALSRAYRTCDLALAHVPGNTHPVAQTPSEREGAVAGSYTPTAETTGEQVTVVQSWRLNERHYGNLQGHKKRDPHLLRVSNLFLFFLFLFLFQKMKERKKGRKKKVETRQAEATGSH